MLSVYAKWKGVGYLKSTLQKVVERLMMTAKDLDLELDPARVSSPEELHKNALQLRIVAKVFIDDICASSASIPPVVAQNMQYRECAAGNTRHLPAADSHL